jgi:hypothetical protein
MTRLAIFPMGVPPSLKTGARPRVLEGHDAPRRVPEQNSGKPTEQRTTVR